MTRTAKSFVKLLIVLLVACNIQALDTPTSSLADYGPATASLFNNMKTPASIIGGSMVPIGFLSPLSFDPDEDDGRLAVCLRRFYPVVAVLSFCSELLSVMWATVAVNQLTETKVTASASVWDLIQRDYALPWAATNAHFVFGMMGFMWVICSRAYFLGRKGALGASVAGLALSGFLLITSIVNRGVAAGGGDGARFGANVFGLFNTYIRLLVKQAFSLATFGPLEAASVTLALVCGVNAMYVILRDFPKKLESKKR